MGENYGGSGGLKVRGGGGGAGVPGPPGTGTRAIAPIAIPAGNTVDVDIILTPATKRFLYYYLLLEQSVTVKVTSVVVHGVSDGVTPSHSCPSEVGDIQFYITDLVISGAAVRLQITNNEANTITVSGQVIET
jgi:hypothetical protein